MNHFSKQDEVRVGPPDLQNLDTRALRYKIYFLVLMVDLAVVLSSFALASIVKFGHPAAPGWFGLVISVTSLYVLVSFSWGGYSLEAITRASLGISRALSALFCSFGMLFLTFYFLKVGPDFSRAMSIMSLGFSAMLLVALRKIVGDWVNSTFGHKLERRVFIMDRALPIDTAGLVANEWIVETCPDPADFKKQLNLAQLFKGADRVIISCDRGSAERWADVLRWSGVQGELLLPHYDAISPIGIARFNKFPTLIVSTGRLSTGQRFSKRTLDLIVAAGLVLLFAPIMGILAIVIKLDSPGPVFFKQERLGQGNVPFMIYKLRTMRDDLADRNGAVSTSRDDQRVTKLGRLLRKTSIDEIPQIYNVLRGEMSIVGPRPHALGSTAEDKLFWEVDDTYWYRHALKPGITGLAQIRGFRGATQTKSQLRERVRADLEYIQGWSILRDLSIIGRTALVLVHPNAY